jgi:predicted MFS family arabinose efflux permease
MGVALLSDRMGKRRSALIGLTGTAAAYLLLPRLPHQLPFAVAGIAFLVLSFEFTIVVLIPLVSGMSAKARGTLMALNTATIAVGRIIGPVLAVALYRPGDLSRNSLVAAFITFVLIVLLFQLHERGH